MVYSIENFHPLKYSYGNRVPEYGMCVPTVGKCVPTVGKSVPTIKKVVSVYVRGPGT